MLRAPFSGIIGAVSARVGDGVVPGVPLVTVVDPEGIAVRLALSEVDIGHVSEGQLGVARFDATPDLVYPVVVSGVGRVPSTATGPATYEVQARVLAGAELADAVRRLGALVAATAEEVARQPRPIAGLAASITLVGAERTGVLVVPLTAVRRDSTRPTVLVSGAGGALGERVVELGATDGTHIEVVSGLSEGDRVVQDHAHRR
ncbi:MAG: HlyD family efflux transporter periplasmic adaptor subunit [Dehalococcoidia bacterium]